jgi:RsmE family RNA methyltransferase
VLQLSLSRPPLERTPLDLIVGVPRPQTVKKVVQAAAMLGVRSVHFVRSELGEKSYLQSHALKEEELHLEGIKALEQVWDSQLPNVRVHRSFDYFMDKQLPSLEDARAVCRLVAHPGGKVLSVQHATTILDEQIVAIGPERGWSDNEVSTFRERGFDVVSLGCRVVRVEVATVLLIGQLQLLSGRI